jgi:hypothetical protein
MFMSSKRVKLGLVERKKLWKSVRFSYILVFIQFVALIDFKKGQKH